MLRSLDGTIPTPGRYTRVRAARTSRPPGCVAAIDMVQDAVTQDLQLLFFQQDNTQRRSNSEYRFPTTRPVCMPRRNTANARRKIPFIHTLSAFVRAQPCLRRDSLFVLSSHLFVPLLHSWRRRINAEQTAISPSTFGAPRGQQTDADKCLGARSGVKKKGQTSTVA